MRWWNGRRRRGWASMIYHENAIELHVTMPRAALLLLAPVTPSLTASILATWIVSLCTTAIIRNAAIMFRTVQAARKVITR